MLQTLNIKDITCGWSYRNVGKIKIYYTKIRSPQSGRDMEGKRKLATRLYNLF